MKTPDFISIEIPKKDLKEGDEIDIRFSEEHMRYHTFKVVRINKWANETRMDLKK